MSKLIYIDTNVYLDYFEERSYGLRPANEFAFNLIQRTIACEFKIVLSTKLLEELEKRVSKEKITDFFNKLRIFNKVFDVRMTFNIKKFAIELSRSGRIHYSDALHYAFASHYGVEAIITNDRNFRELSSEKLRILMPEEV